MSKGIELDGLEGADPINEWGGSGILGVGWHEVEITRAEEGESSGGHPQVEIQFVAKNEDEIRDWLVFAKAPAGQVSFAVRKAKGLLDAISVTSENGNKFPTDAIVGKSLDIYVGEEEYQGETKHRVQGYATAGSKANESDVPEDGIPF